MPGPQALRAVLVAIGFCGSVALVAARTEAVTLGARPPAAARTSTPPPTLHSAGAFLMQEIDDKEHGRWARVWQSLYPLHQHVAPRIVFVRCETATPFPAALRSSHLVLVRRDLVRVPGLERRIAGAAVTVRVELAWYGPRDPITFDHTFHLVAMNGRWRWLLSTSRYLLYQHEGCGVVPSL